MTNRALMRTAGHALKDTFTNILRGSPGEARGCTRQPLCRLEVAPLHEADCNTPGPLVSRGRGHCRAGECGAQAYHYASVALSRQPPLVFWSADEAQASIDRVVRLADVIYPGHDRPFRLTAEREVEYLRDFSLTITGTPPDQPGLGFYPKTREPWVMPGIEDQPRRSR